MLSKTGDVNEEGEFITQFTDPKKRMGKSLAALSSGRVGISQNVAWNGVIAITIAIRYSAARQQFGPDGSDIEFPVIEYQAQQYRLLPHLASAYALLFFGNFVGKAYADMTIKMMSEEDVSLEGMEIHALSSVGKPICSWTSRNIIQECREACGGHGYLKCARLGDTNRMKSQTCKQNLQTPFKTLCRRLEKRKRCELHV